MFKGPLGKAVPRTRISLRADTTPFPAGFEECGFLIGGHPPGLDIGRGTAAGLENITGPGCSRPNAEFFEIAIGLEQFGERGEDRRITFEPHDEARFVAGDSLSIHGDFPEMAE